MNDIFNVYDKWSPLQEVVIGRSYSADFYSGIKNHKIKSCLQRIADETEEDFLYFQEQLRSHGVKVHRPELDANDRIENYSDGQGRIATNFSLVDGTWQNECKNSQNVFVSNTLIPKPPMTPRDCWIVLDDSILNTAIDHDSVTDVIKKIAGVDNQNLIIDCYKEFDSEADFPGGNIYQIGYDLIFGTDGIRPEVVSKITDRFSKFQWHFVDLHGHNDGSYHPIKPGAILSVFDVHFYEKLFPNWDILYLPNESWIKMNKFIKLKEKNAGKWWVPGEEQNDEFTYFVETWLKDWVGYAEETVFDVNCLCLDEKYVFVNNHNPEVKKFLNKHGMEPIVIPFRHRYFWDGGLHCCTLEIKRSGELGRFL